MSTDLTPAAAPEYPDHIDAKVLITAGAVVLGMIMAILDTTVVNVALPTFQVDFGTKGNPLEFSAVAWTVTGYTLALATVIPLTGWAADRFGTKRLYILAIGLFTAGSVLCATAGDINQLIAYRVIQGLGGGMLMPLGMTIMTKAAGPKRMGRLMAILGVPMLLGPILGPILGGYLIDHASWHWIFLINLPLGVVALVYAWFVLDSDTSKPGETFDFVGMLMLSPGLALFLYGVSSVPTAPVGFGKTEVWLPMTVGALLIVAFGFYSFRPKHPLLDLRLFKNYNLSIAVIVMALFFISFFGSLLLVPTYFQQVREATPFKAGLLMAPQGLGAMLTMPLAGWLSEKFPVGRIAPFGLVLVLAGLGGFTQIAADTSYWYTSAILFVTGLGMGLTMMPLMTSALRTLQSHEVARGSTLVNINQQIAASAGAAIMSVILTNQINGSKVISASKDIAEAQAKQSQPSASSLATLQDNIKGLPDLVSAGAKIAEAKLTGQAPPAEAVAAINTFATMVRQANLDALANAFAFTFAVGTALVGITLVVSLLLPKKNEESHFADDQGAAPIVIH
jgi:EmrB/QacA subfamily drug resistance transporter